MIATTYCKIKNIEFVTPANLFGETKKRNFKVIVGQPATINCPARQHPIASSKLLCYMNRNHNKGNSNENLKTYANAYPPGTFTSFSIKNAFKVQPRKVSKNPKIPLI
jgi:hypothetical protein